MLALKLMAVGRQMTFALMYHTRQTSLIDPGPEFISKTLSDFGIPDAFQSRHKSDRRRVTGV